MLQSLCGLIIADCISDVIQGLKREAGLEELFSVGERFKFVIGRHHPFVAIAFALFAFGVVEGFGKEAGPVVIDIRHEVVLIEAVHLRCELLGNMAVPEDFAYDSGIF